MQRILAVFISILIFLTLFFAYFRPITAINEDLGRHLLIGKSLMETHSFLRTNYYSYTFPNFPFINQPWLSQAIYYLVFAHTGFFGLTVLTMFLGIIPFGILFVYSAKRFGLTPTILSSLLYINLLFARTDVRPELFGCLLLSLMMLLLYKFRSHPSKLVLLVIQIELLWVNLHIYFVIGVVVVFLFFLDQLFLNKFRLSKSLELLGITLFFVLGATLLNPYGLQGTLFPFTFHQNYGINVTENQNLLAVNALFPQTSITFFFVTVICLFFLLWVQRKRTAPIDWMLALFFTVLAFSIYRTMQLFVYGTFISFVSALSLTVPVIMKKLAKFVAKPYMNLIKYYCLGVLVLYLMGSLGKMLAQQPVGFGVDEKGKKAADFYLENRLQGPIFNNYDIGGYLIYRLYPQKVFIDSRPEAYPSEFFKNDYLPLQTHPELFEQLDNKYQYNVLFLSHWDRTPYQNNFLRYLLNNNSYSLVYLDDYALILLKNTPANEAIIQKYHLNEHNVSVTSSNLDSLVRYIYLFEKIDWERQEILTYEKLRKLDPGNCTIKNYLGTIRQGSLPTLEKKYTLQFSKQCL